MKSTALLCALSLLASASLACSGESFSNDETNAGETASTTPSGDGGSRGNDDESSEEGAAVSPTTPGEPQPDEPPNESQPNESQPSAPEPSPSGAGGVPNRPAPSPAGTGGAGGAPDEPEPATPASLGSACASDADCTDGITTCLIDALATHGGSIAGGICTVRCERDPDVCGLGICTGSNNGTPDDPSDDIAYCYDYCFYTEEAAKCGNLRNRVCYPVDASGLGACYPKCYSDGDCETGYCDPFSFACVAERPPGAPDGSLCIEDTDCFGMICMRGAETEAEGVCLSECSLQAETLACHRALGDASPVASACFPPLPLLANGVPIANYDYGNCLPTCDTDSPCVHPDWTCVDLEEPFFTDDTGYVGVCIPTLLLE